MAALTEAPVWVPCPTGYEQGFAQSTISLFGEDARAARRVSSSAPSDDALIPVKLSNGPIVTRHAHELLPSDVHFGHRDNASLAYLNAPNLLENIATRYDEAYASEASYEKIYTFTGWLLIAVNPYRPTAALYNEARLHFYMGKPISAVPPHPFAVAEASYNSLLKHWKSQSIIISGESGSGKTECSKHVLKYLAFISDKRHDANNQGIESRVLQTNPILEAFGNAKTVYNDNSSRFGKLMKLHFDRRGRMLGASIRTYLLAKSRVCHVPQRERNYHIFHWMCRGACQNERDDWRLRTAEQYRYLDSEAPAEGMSQLQEVRTALESIGLPMATKQKQVFRVLSAILALGNLIFTTGTRVDGVSDVTILERTPKKIPPPSSTRAGGPGSSSNNEDKENVSPPTEAAAAHENKETTLDDDVAVIQDLLGLITESARQEFELVLTSKKIRDSRKNLTDIQAKQTVDALARSLYQLVFDYLVRRINVALSYRSTADMKKGRHPSAGGPPAGLSSGGQREPHRYIGILDIFGFENLAPYSPNSFEQLCINYANERLHHFFLDQVVYREKQLYLIEGLLPPETTGVVSNIDVCNTITGTKAQTGIFGLLDEASLIPVVGSKDEYFCSKVNTQLAVALPQAPRGSVAAPGKHSSSEGDRPTNTVAVVAPAKLRGTREFIVRHFAGDVPYTAAGFCERNVDHISNDLRDFLIFSCDPFISQELCFPLLLNVARAPGSPDCPRCSSSSGTGKVQARPEDRPPRPPSLVAARARSETHTEASSGSSTAPVLRRESSSSTIGRAGSSMVVADGVCAACLYQEAIEKEGLLFEDSDTESDSDGPTPSGRLSSAPHTTEGPRQSRAHDELVGREQQGGRSRSSSAQSRGGGRTGAMKSLASLFASQVDGLMTTLGKTTSLFVRCIKPNDDQKPKQFNRGRVMQQLERGGMVGVLELMTRGFPCRVPYQDLWQRYNTILPETMRDQITPRDFTEIILLFLKTRPSDYRIGHTRAFFRFGTLTALETIASTTDTETQQRIAKETFSFWLRRKRRRALMAVRCSVALWLWTVKNAARERCRLLAIEAQKYYETVYCARRQARAATTIQRHWRGHITRQVYLHLRMRRYAATLIQKAWRGYAVRLSYMHFRACIILIQKWCRGHRARRRYREIRDSGQMLQDIAGCVLIRRRHIDAMHTVFAVMRIQAAWCGYRTRCWYLAELQRRQQEEEQQLLQKQRRQEEEQEILRKQQEEMQFLRQRQEEQQRQQEQEAILRQRQQEQLRQQEEEEMLRQEHERRYQQKQPQQEHMLVRNSRASVQARLSPPRPPRRARSDETNVIPPQAAVATATAASWSGDSVKRRRLLHGTFTSGDSSSHGSRVPPPPPQQEDIEEQVSGGVVPRLAVETIPLTLRADTGPPSAVPSEGHPTPRFPSKTSARPTLVRMPSQSDETSISTERCGQRNSAAAASAKDLERFSVMGAYPAAPAAVVAGPPVNVMDHTNSGRRPPTTPSSFLAAGASAFEPTTSDPAFYTPREPPSSPNHGGGGIGIFGEYVDGRWVPLDAAAIHERLHPPSARTRATIAGTVLNPPHPYPPTSRGQHQPRLAPMHKPWAQGDACPTAPETPSLYGGGAGRHTPPAGNAVTRATVGDATAAAYYNGPRKPPSSGSSPRQPDSRLFNGPQFREAVLSVFFDALDEPARQQVLNKLRRKRQQPYPQASSCSREDTTDDKMGCDALIAASVEAALRYEDEGSRRRSAASTDTPVPRHVGGGDNATGYGPLLESRTGEVHHNEGGGPFQQQRQQPQYVSRDQRRVSWLNFGPPREELEERWDSRVLSGGTDNDDDADAVSPLIKLHRRRITALLSNSATAPSSATDEQEEALLPLPTTTSSDDIGDDPLLSVGGGTGPSSSVEGKNQDGPTTRWMPSEETTAPPPNYDDGRGMVRSTTASSASEYHTGFMPRTSDGSYSQMAAAPPPASFQQGGGGAVGSSRIPRITAHRGGPARYEAGHPEGAGYSEDAGHVLLYDGSGRRLSKQSESAYLDSLRRSSMSSTTRRQISTESFGQPHYEWSTSGGADHHPASSSAVRPAGCIPSIAGRRQSRIGTMAVGDGRGGPLSRGNITQEYPEGRPSVRSLDEAALSSAARQRVKRLSGASVTTEGVPLHRRGSVGIPRGPIHSAHQGRIGRPPRGPPGG